jgi:hypothetical protein
VAQGTIGFAAKKRLQVGFTEADLTPWSAAGYPGCQILPEAITRPPLPGEREAEGRHPEDGSPHGLRGLQSRPDGFQIAHKMLMFRWQDGKKVIVWPEELAPRKARFPTPPGSQRP